MGKVVLNTPQGKVNITIAGEKPTIEESIQINNIIRKTRGGQNISKDENMIENTGLTLKKEGEVDKILTNW